MTDRSPPYFVGGHPALDFLNTIATPTDVPVEWLRGGHDLMDWLVPAKLIAPDVAARFRATNDHREIDRVATRAREFRDWLRVFVTRHMGRPLTPRAATTLGTLNDLLAGDCNYPVVEVDEGRSAFRLRRVRQWTSPEELLHPIVEAAADLICCVDFRLIRACDGPVCTLLFLDGTKAHGRRWCSMAVCGNRAKAAAYRARKAGN
jgi:predicted RNA-binding Zn ribbon-like protein